MNNVETAAIKNNNFFIPLSLLLPRILRPSSDECKPGGMHHLGAKLHRAGRLAALPNRENRLLWFKDRTIGLTASRSICLLLAS